MLLVEIGRRRGGLFLFLFTYKFTPEEATLGNFFARGLILADQEQTMTTIPESLYIDEALLISNYIAVEVL